MTINLKGELNDDMLEKLIAFYNSLKEDIAPIIMLSSNGGQCHIAEMMKVVIESNPESKLIAYGDIQSSAFWLFFKTNCKKFLGPNCLGMFHQSYMEMDINQSLLPNFNVDKQKSIYMKNFLLPYNEEFCKSMNFTEAEMKKYRKGDDVYFMPDRMQEFLKQREK